MRVAQVYWNDQLAGLLTQHSLLNYEFEYDDGWMLDDSKPPISLTLPKRHKKFQADHLFPFFFNMLSEGANRQLQNRALKIDEADHFGLLLAISSTDSTGAVTLKSLISEPG